MEQTELSGRDWRILIGDVSTERDYFKKRADYWDKTILGDIAKGAFLPPEDLLSIVGEVAQARLGELNKTAGPKP